MYVIEGIHQNGCSFFIGQLPTGKMVELMPQARDLFKRNQEFDHLYKFRFKWQATVYAKMYINNRTRYNLTPTMVFIRKLITGKPKLINLFFIKFYV